VKERSGHHVEVEGMREVRWVDCRIRGRVRAVDVYTTARQRTCTACAYGAPHTLFYRRKQSASRLWVLHLCARRQHYDLTNCFFGIEELAPIEGVATCRVGIGMFTAEVFKERLDVRLCVWKVGLDLCKRGEACRCRRSCKWTGFVGNVCF